MSFLNNLLNHGFLLHCFPAHEASNGEGSKTSLYSFLQKHSGNAKGASTLRWYIPPMKLQKCDVLLSIQSFDVLDSVRGVRLLSLRPVKPVKGAILKLQGNGANMRRNRHEFESIKHRLKQESMLDSTDKLSSN